MAFVSKRVLGSAAGVSFGFARCISILGVQVVSLAAPLTLAGATEGRPLFNKDIRPILADNCYHCHGFDSGSRQADLRLDVHEGATAVKEGRQAVKPGDLQASELWRRINSGDPKVRMPPPDSGKELKPAEVAVLGKWIEQGAAYQKHWAFEPITRPEPPSSRLADAARNDVDRFILSTLASRQLQPAPEASKETLIRRVTLDLTGLPPTLSEVEAFLADDTPGAYERLVDRLLSSPRYGEHMARYWLDVARYGDTHGLHLDNERSLWPYRDWVVRAFNDNLSFDRFTIWQLAGDLLPEPTREQLIASGFNRCNVSTSEGGAIDEEFRVVYAVDRVETTSAAWMGLTMGCAVCHDHKLDPITQKEFYQVFSIFNNIAENAMDGNALLPPPTLQLPSPEQERQFKDIADQIAGLEKRIAGTVASLQYIDPATATNRPVPEPVETVWLEDDFPPEANLEVNSGNPLPNWVLSDKGPVHSGQRSLQRTGPGLHQVFFTRSSMPLQLGSNSRIFAHVYIDPKDSPKAIMLQFHLKGWENRAIWGDEEAIPYGEKGTHQKVRIGDLPERGKWVKLEFEASRLGLGAGAKLTGIAFTQFDGSVYWDGIGAISANDPAENPAISFAAWRKSERSLGDKSAAPGEIKKLLKRDFSELEEDDSKKLLQHYLTASYADPETPLASFRSEIRALRQKRQDIEKGVPATMVSKELEKPRPAWVLTRGEYDKHGEPVGPGVPSILPPLPPSERTNRLTFARWLVDPQHPLTARVTVNRFWQQFFGTGLVKTTQDFGTKAEWPSHPDLLDWLATEFIRTDWDMKHLVRLIVTSATYRQDAKVTPELLEKDPENRLLARGPRHRMDAEMLRDTALHVSGLINLTMGGRGVRPYQPPGIWEAVGYTTSDTAKYTQDHGDALYRRSLYLFWKRTAPPPSMTTFDAPSREKCTTRRERTNTPLQALLTMNDPQYFEAARHLGYRMLREGGSCDADRLRYGFRLVTSRKPTDSEAAVMAETLEKARNHYSGNAEAAGKAIRVGESKTPEDVPASELASYSIMANLLLNLDEALTRN